MPDEKLNFAEIIKGHPDILTGLAKDAQRALTSSACPYCQSSAVRSFIPPERPFLPNDPLPNVLMRCQDCGTEFNPRSGIVVKLRSASI